MSTLLATGLFERIWDDPFGYAWKAVLVVFAIGFIVNAIRGQFED